MGTGHIYYSKPALFTCHTEFSVMVGSHPDGVVNRQYEDHPIAFPARPHRSAIPFCLPHPLTLITVMPCIPISSRAINCT